MEKKRSLLNHRLQQVPGRIQGLLPNLSRLINRCLRWNTLLVLLFTLIALGMVDRFLQRTSRTARTTAIHQETRGVRRVAEQLTRGTEVRVLRWEYRWYKVKSASGKSGWIPRNSLAVANPWLEHFVPTVFSKNERPDAIPFKRERHTVRYKERNSGRLRSRNEVYWRLTMPVLLLLAAAFCPGFRRPLFKSIASIGFFTLLLIYSLFAAGDLYKRGYANVSYFRQVALRIPYSHTGMVFTPDRAWLLRVRAFLGMRKEVVLASRATPDTIKGSYLISSIKGYTPGWALKGAILKYSNGPARLYYIPE